MDGTKYLDKQVKDPIVIEIIDGSAEVKVEEVSSILSNESDDDAEEMYFKFIGFKQDV